jgi:hypothetical protein
VDVEDEVSTVFVDLVLQVDLQLDADHVRAAPGGALQMDSCIDAVCAPPR